MNVRSILFLAALATTSLAMLRSADAVEARLIIETAFFPEHALIFPYCGLVVEACEEVFPNPGETMFPMQDGRPGYIVRRAIPGMSIFQPDPNGRNDFLHETQHVWEHGTELFWEWYDVIKDEVEEDRQTIEEVIDHIQDWPIWGWAWTGDANLDGAVNMADFLILSNNFGSDSANWLDGDFDGDGCVDFTDYLLLADNFDTDS